MEIVWGADDTPERNRMLGEWCAAQLGHPLSGPYATMGVVDGDSLIAVVVYHNWSRKRGVIELSAASTSPRWLARPVLFQMFAYPFQHLGCQTVVLRVSERNPRMLGIALRFGFEAHRIPRLRGRDEAEIILTLTDDDWLGNGFYDGR